MNERSAIFFQLFFSDLSSFGLEFIKSNGEQKIKHKSRENGTLFKSIIPVILIFKIKLSINPISLKNEDLCTFPSAMKRILKAIKQVENANSIFIRNVLLS